MKLNLESLFKALAWPVGLVAVFSAVLLVFGIQLDLVLTIGGSMLGAQILISVAVDVLKYVGVIADGSAGKWSAAFQLFGLAGIAVALRLYPEFNFPALDAQLQVIAQFAMLIFGFIIQVSGAKQVHKAVVKGFGVRSFSFSYA